MRKYEVASMLLLTTIVANADNASVPDVKAGMWEITSTAQMSGLPMQMPPVTSSVKDCMTKEKATDPRTMLQNQQCQMSEMNVQANTVSWKISCQQQGTQMSGDGNMTYQAESFSGVFNLTMQAEGEMAMNMTTQINGRYLGACQ